MVSLWEDIDVMTRYPKFNPNISQIGKPEARKRQMVGRKEDNLGKRRPLLDVTEVTDMSNIKLTGVPANAEGTERQLQIPMWVCNINNKMDVAVKNFHELRSRLTPVLDEKVLQMVDEDMGRVGGAPLAVDLEDIDIRISCLASDLDKVIKALEI